MARNDKKRIRLTLRSAWRTGSFSMRVGRPSKNVFNRWVRLIKEADRRAQTEILDVLKDGHLSFPDASRIATEDGFDALADHARSLLTSDSPRITQLLDEFIQDQPRKASRKHHLRIRARCEEFARFILDSEGLESLEDVTTEHWTRTNLQRYKTAYVDRSVAAAMERKERAWAAEGRDVLKSEHKTAEERERSKKEVTANRHVNAIGAFSDHLVEISHLDENPATGLRINAKDEKTHRTGIRNHMEPHEWQAFLAAARATDGIETRGRVSSLFWEWLVTSGATAYTEGTRLTRADLVRHPASEGFVKLPIHGSKTSYRSREVPIPEAVVRRLLGRADRLGLGNDQQIFPYTCDDGRTAWDSAMAHLAETKPEIHAEIRGLTPSCLRHTFAMTAMSSGVNIRRLQVLMGHSNIATTEQYLRKPPQPIEPFRAAANTLGVATPSGEDANPILEEAKRMLAEAKRGGKTAVDVLAAILDRMEE